MSMYDKTEHIYRWHAYMIHSTVDTARHTHDRPRYVYAVHTRTFHTQRESDDDPNANNVLVVTARG